MLISAATVFFERTLVAVCVNQWSLDDEHQCFALVPDETRPDAPLVEVGIVVAQDQPTVVAPVMPDWRSIKDESFEAGESGYPLTPQAAEDLYYVWDDGAHHHMMRAQRLYTYYKTRIDFYRAAALEYHLVQYKQAIGRAKDRGWDPALIARPSAYRYFAGD